jgi:hypothetical protein
MHATDTPGGRSTWPNAMGFDGRDRPRTPCAAVPTPRGAGPLVECHLHVADGDGQLLPVQERNLESAFLSVDTAPERWHRP